MSNGRDDDALTWDGDDDPTLAARTETPADAGAPRDERLPRGFTTVGRGSERVPRTSARAEREARPDSVPLGNAALVAIGMIAAAFILFAVGWLIVSLRLQSVEGLPVPQIALVVISLVAAAAPLIWFATVFALTRGSRTWVRFTWLVAGVVLLVPWPFLVTGALG